MTEQSQMPLVGPSKRRGWREIVRFRPLTASTNAALVVTRRGRMVSILPAGGPRVLSDYLAWPYDFREVDTRERLLVIDQRVESFDSNYEFAVTLRLSYQVVQPDRVALELEDVAAELVHAVVQSLRLSGRSFGVEQDNIFEEHLQETLLSGDMLLQRVQMLGLALRRADVAVALDEPTRAHAEALRFAMRERPLHFQIAIESLDPDRSFDVIVGGSYRLVDRRVQDGSGDAADSAIQLAITRSLQRVGITFEPSDYPNAAKAMADVLRKDGLLQSELSMVHAQLLRPTVQIQPDRSMVHVPRPSMLGVSDLHPDPVLRRVRQGLPRMSRPPALMDMQESVQQQAPAPAVRRALPPPDLSPADPAVAQAAPPEPPVDIAASQILPLGELPAPGDSIEGGFTAWPRAESLPVMRALPMLGQPDDAQDADAPWADLIGAAEAASPDRAWPSSSLTNSPELLEPLPWEAAIADSAEQPAAQEYMSEWPSIPSTKLPESIEPLPWEAAALEGAEQPSAEEQAPEWLVAPPASLGELADALPWEEPALDGADQPMLGAALPAEDAESGLNAVHEFDTATHVPAFMEHDTPVEPGSLLDWIGPVGAPAADPLPDLSSPDNVFVDDLGFSLDWSESEVAEQEIEPPASAHAPEADRPVDDLGFALDWSQTQPDPYASVWAPQADSTTDDTVIMAHWDDLSSDPAEPALMSDSPADASAAANTLAAGYSPSPIFGLDPAHSELQQALTADMPIWAEPSAADAAAQAAAEQEAPPWYAPTMQLDDHLPFDSATDDRAAAPLESFQAAWTEQPEAPSTPASEAAADAFHSLPAEAFAEEPATIESAYDFATDTGSPALDERSDVWVEQPEAPSTPAYNLSTDGLPDLPNEEVDREPAASIELAGDAAPDDADARLAEPVDALEEIPAEQILRIIGMIQSYGPAWFKMWSLELKERPERLPVVLGEVTADPVLLAQANDPRVQSALLLALAAYTSPTTFLARLPASAPLPSPAVAGQKGDGEDEVPDWLSLRVKWNGQGGGA